MDDKPYELLTPGPSCCKRIVAAQALLASALTVAFLVAVFFADQRAGSPGVAAAVVALLVSWAPNAVSLCVMGLLRDPQQSVSAMLLSMLLRMGLPMVILIVLSETRHWLVDAGALPMILVFYLVALVVETILSLWVLGTFAKPIAKAS